MKKTRHKFSFIRSALGCSQDQLATCLGITRGLLSHVELNRRVMPSKAELRLLDIYKLLLEEPTQPEEVRPPVPGDLKQLQWIWQSQLERQRKLVDALEKKRGTALSQQVYAGKIRQSLVIDKAFDVFLRMLEAESASFLHRVTAEKIALEQLKLQALEAGAAVVAKG